MSVDVRQSLHCKVLIATLIVFAVDLSSSGRGAQAWTYNYRTGPNQTWHEARQWCQKYFIDMVAIRNPEESDFLNNLLPFNEKYYWIGIQRVAGLWTWVDTSQNIPEAAQNWATAEPDSLPRQDCVEIYIKRGIDTAKWNNEKCHNKKGTICYTASCKQKSCSAHADCVETTGNYTCKCHPGFQGPRCEEAITCKPLSHPDQGSHHCSHPYGSNRFNSSCHFLCKVGFRLVGTPQLICQATGHWNHPVPLCQAAQCPYLKHTDFSGGSVNCSHPIAPFSYNSTCEFRCDEGYELIGQDQTICDHTGQWTASFPACTVIKCPPIFSPVMGNMTCVDPVEPFSYGSWCNFTCQEGYYLTGDKALTCLTSKQWSKSTPTCRVVQCTSLQAPPHADMQCQDPIKEHSYTSICTVQCEEGFDLIGTNMTKCSSQGNWSHPLPVCQAKRCSPIHSPPHGSISCSDPNGSFSFGSRCTKTCDEGFLLNGTSSTACTFMGMWTADIPPCLAKKCPTLNSPDHGSIVCSDPHGEFSFGSRCTTICDDGFVLNGTAVTECTSMSTWSTDIPYCLAKKCPTLNSPDHGSVVCSDPHGEFSFGSRCTTTCDEGFVLNGTAVTECSSTTNWTTDIPYCLAKKCPTLNSPDHSSIVCSDPHGEFSFGSRCTTTCDEGFVLNGTAVTECTSMRNWTTDIPYCLAKKCPTLNSPDHGSVVCSDPHGEFSFGSRCTTTCDEGFVLNGTAVTECTSMRNWSTDIPYCLAKKCPTLNSPDHGSIICSDPHGEFSFGSRCTTTCDDGFVLNGTAVTECTSMSTWSTDIPYCLAKKCPTLNSPDHGSVVCSDPHGEFSFGSRCTTTCDEGFVLNGTAVTECSSTTNWTTDIPYCSAKKCPTLNSPDHGSVVCSDPHGEFSFGSHCTTTCKEGFLLNGTADTECTFQSHWSADIPQCLARRCPTLNSPSHGSLACSSPHGDYSFASVCTSTCAEGFVLNGTAITECTLQGTWNRDVPNCFAKSCPPLTPPAHGSLVCSDSHSEFSFGSRCTSSCVDGFFLTGTADTECTSAGAWSRGMPDCKARQCPLLAKAPQHGRMNCSHLNSPFSYGSQCDFECNKGFWLKGTSSMACNTSGQWSQDLPTCQPVQCKAIRAFSSVLSMNCSHPLGNFSFGSKCLFTCKDGFTLNGTAVLLCSATGIWSDSLPSCTGMSFGTAMLLYTGAGTGTAVVILLLIGLAMLIMTQFKKRGNNIVSDVPTWGERENPAFEF
ncbi:P-selectin [Archocentrus centrarchus]|uniref:P-selectin n=1 Tax=Archocentrus centrarchus TaxID=63155 RepID=UPI0011EA13BD|nr:P-selectin-like [Archocentrus centrarchus]